MSEFSIGRFGSVGPRPLQENFVSNKESLGAANKTQGSTESSQSFMDTLEGILKETNQTLKSADKASQDLAAGRADNLHSVMIAMEKADLSLRTVNAIRNKMVEAYQEIMRMQV